MPVQALELQRSYSTILHFAGWLISITIFTSIPNKITTRMSSWWAEEFPQEAREYDYFPSRELSEKKQARKIHGLVGVDFEDKFAKAQSEKNTAAAQERLALDVQRRTSHGQATSPQASITTSSRAPDSSSRARAILFSRAPDTTYSRARITATSRLKNGHLSRKRKKRGLNMLSEKAQRLNDSTRKSRKTRARLPENIQETSSVYEENTFEPITEEFDQLSGPSHRTDGHSGLSDSDIETADLSIIEVSSDDTSNSDTDTDGEGSVAHDVADLDAGTDVYSDASGV